MQTHWLLWNHSTEAFVQGRRKDTGKPFLVAFTNREKAERYMAEHRLGNVLPIRYKSPEHKSIIESLRRENFKIMEAKNGFQTDGQTVQGQGEQPALDIPAQGS